MPWKNVGFVHTFSKNATQNTSWTRTSDVPMQVVCKLTEVDKTTPEELLSERIVELAVGGLRPQAGTEPVPRNLPS